MKSSRSHLLLSILAGGFSFVGTASAIDLIWNGSFEIPGPAEFDFVGPNSGSGTDWNGYFRQYNHSDVFYAPPDIPAGENPGDKYGWRCAAFFGGWDNYLPDPNATLDELDFLNNQLYAYALNQTVALTNAVPAANIDSGLGQYTFSAWLASYTDNPEQPFVMLRFFDDTATQNTSTGVQIGNDGYPTPDAFTTSVIFDRTTNTLAVTFADGTTTIPADLSTNHNWVKYVATGTVPVGARNARIYVTRSPNAGKSGSPDTYVDLVKLNVIDTSQSTVKPPIIVRPPADQITAIGNEAKFSAGALGAGPLSYQWRFNGTNIPGASATIPGDTVVPTLSLPVPKIVGNYSVDVVVTNTGGAITSSPPATLTVINPAVFVTGQWDFLNGNLAATMGAPLEYGNATAQNDTTFGTTTSFGIPNINGVPAAIMHFSPSSSPAWWGYKMFPSTGPNGGGTNINQYTLIYDIYYPVGTDGYRTLWQTDTNNTQYGSLYIGNADVGFGIGVGVTYDGSFTNGVWHRIAFAIDLNGPGGQPPVMAKFIDGVKVADQTADLSPLDDWLSLGAYGYLFAEAADDFPPGYVSSIQFSNGRRPDAFIEALGGPSALKIPGAIKADLSGSVVTIRWTGGVSLQSAPSLTGPWTTVPGTAGQSSYQPSPLSTAQFYRPQIP